MLHWLRLRDFVIVESAEIEFGPGFTVLTGETGAGKSILLDAMGLVLGGLIGGPVARKLVNKMGMKPSAKAVQAHDTADTAIDDVFEHAHQRASA